MAIRGRTLRWVLLGVAIIVVVAVAAPFVYIHFIEGPAPAKLTLPKISSTTTPGATTGSTSGATGDLSGTWHVGPGSVVGYRVQEVLLGQQSTAVGRTTKVSGSFVVAGTVVRSGSATADMASVTSDQSERNAQFDGRIMEVGTYPTATLVLTRPIVLDPSFAEGSVHQYPASADLTLHGVTKPVTFTVSTERRGGTVYALTDIPIVFADWGIDNPSIGGFVTTQSTGTLEVLLALTMGTGNAPVTRASSGAAPPSGGGGPITVPSTTVPPLKVPSS